MRIEDVIVRYLPGGGTVADHRAEPRPRLSFAAGSAIVEVDPGATADLILTWMPSSAHDEEPGRAVTLISLPDDAGLPDVLAWAGARKAQVVEISRVLAPPVTAVVVRHGAPAEVPAVPGRSEPLPANEETWKRLAGELLAERHLAAIREGDLDRLRAEVIKLRRSSRKAQGATGASPDGAHPGDSAKPSPGSAAARKPPHPRLRLRLPGSRRRPGGDGG